MVVCVRVRVCVFQFACLTESISLELNYRWQRKVERTTSCQSNCINKAKDENCRRRR